MRLHKVESLHRKELTSLLRLLAPEEVFPYEDAAHVNLVELVYSALGYMFVGEPLEFSELELEYMKRLSGILDVEIQEGALESWNEALKRELGERVISELMPILEVAHLMSWADGDFVSEELQVYDLVFSQLKLLRPFKKDIVDLCLSPLPVGTVKADLAPIAANREKSRCILSFAWAIANVDAQTHETEITLFNELGEVLGFTPEQRREVQVYVKNRWKYLMSKEKIASPAQLVLYSSGIDDYIRHVVGFDAFQIVSTGGTNTPHSGGGSRRSIADAFNSLTLFSKMSLISGPELTLMDRVVLVLGLVLSEIVSPE